MTGIAVGFAVEAIGSTGISILPVCYLFCGYVCGYFTKAIYPKGILPFLTVLAAAVPVRAVITLLYVSVQYSSIRILELMIHTILPEMIMTFVFGVVMFYPVKGICKWMNRS